MGLDSFADEVVLNVDVFGASMVGQVSGENDCSGIVIPDSSGVLGVSHEFDQFL